MSMLKLKPNVNLPRLLCIVVSAAQKWRVWTIWWVLRWLLLLKVAEHSFRARFCWCDSARAQGSQKTNMPSIERSFYLLKTRTICAIFLYNWTQSIDGFNLLLQRYVRKGNDAKEPAIFSFFVVTEKNPVKCSACVVSQKIAIEWKIAFSEIRLFLENHSLEFNEIWHENTLGYK